MDDVAADDCVASNNNIGAETNVRGKYKALTLEDKSAVIYSIDIDKMKKIGSCQELSHFYLNSAVHLQTKGQAKNALENSNFNRNKKLMKQCEFAQVFSSG